MHSLRIGTLGSDLALWQALYIQSRLNELKVDSEIVIIKTKGDQIQHLSFDKMEGKGFFTKEIEEALLKDEVDIAIHSHKDLETTDPDGLSIVAMPQRSFPNDILLIRNESVDVSAPLKLKPNAIVGSSSARRKTQILAAFPDCKVIDLRGNVPTRIEKLRSGLYDGILLAKAGVARLNLDLSDLTVVDLDPLSFIPAPAQGALAVQMKTNHPMRAVVAQLHNNEEAECVEIERALMRGMNGGCQMPFGAFCSKNQDGYEVSAMYAVSASTLPVVIHERGHQSQALVDSILGKFRAELPRRRVFISRPLAENHPLRLTGNASGVEWVDLPLIGFNELIFQSRIYHDEVLFLSSPQAARMLRSLDLSINCSIAVMGPGTADALPDNVLPDFVGRGNVEDVKATFKTFLGDRKAVFFIGEGSRRSVQKALPESQYREIIGYSTHPKDMVLPKCDVYVITSPSNTISFSPHGQDVKVVAVGKATHEALLEKGIQSTISKDYTHFGIWNAIFSALRS